MRAQDDRRLAGASALVLEDPSLLRQQCYVNGGWLDAAAIVAIVFLNGVLGFIQEFRAERSLAALRKMSVAMARVIRGDIRAG